MKNSQILILKMLMLAWAVISLTSCEKDPVTLALHSPIQPNANETVTYSIERVTSGTIKSAKLYEQVNQINASGTITSTGTETLLRTWDNPTSDLSHIKSSGNPANSLVTYRFEIETPDVTKRYKVTYATRPFPVTNRPAPIYAQGNPDDVFDVVFIPDTDITDMRQFRNNCRGAIRDAFFSAKHTRLWRKQFNFYINPLRGTATDYNLLVAGGPSHQTPTNWGNLNFAEGKVLMHQNNLRDYATGSLFSTEMQNRGTILHESGHSLFGLADEYVGGVHWQAAEYPNNFSSQANCTAAGDDYGNCKTAADCVPIGTSGFYKLCNPNCQMNTSGLAHTEFDCPDQYRINLEVSKNASPSTP